MPVRFAPVALILAFAAPPACVKASTTGPPSEGQTSGAATSGAAGVEVNPAPREAPPTELARGPVLPAGARCDSDADCGAEEVCEGLGCGAQEGRCAARERSCTRDLATYCACDGAEFQASGSCPGARFAYRGPCSAALEDGERCSDGRQCRSGQCLGEGLEGCSSTASGVCGAQDCTQDAMLYCGCNGVEFEASGSCPDRQFAYRGPCEVASEP